MQAPTMRELRKYNIACLSEVRIPDSGHSVIKVPGEVACYHLAADEAKNSFYDDLQDAVDRVPAGDMLIVAGDWNAGPGAVDTATRHILGKFTDGTRCANGDRLIKFASPNRLVVSSTRFQYPQRRLVTWFSNDGRTRNQTNASVVPLGLLRDRLPGSQWGSNRK